VLALLQTSGFRLTTEDRLPDGRDKIRILRAVDRARALVPLRPSCGSCDCRRVVPCLATAAARRVQSMISRPAPRTSPYRLRPQRSGQSRTWSPRPDYRHVPTGTLAVLAQRLGTVWASPSTWYRLVRKYGWRRPRLRVHPAKPKIGLRTTRADEVWHIDTTVIRLLDGTRAYLHAVIDNYSRRILAWRVADTFAPSTA